MIKCSVVLLIFIISAVSAFAKEFTGFGIHGGIGTDINLGLAVGIGASYATPLDENVSIEYGIDVFYSYFVDKYTEGIYSYHYTETTVLWIFAATFNTLFFYDPRKPGIFLIAGTGAGVINLDWKIESTEDKTANDEINPTTGGLIINLGVGGTLGGGFEIRLQTPLIYVIGGAKSSAFVPTLTLSAGYRF